MTRHMVLISDSPEHQRDLQMIVPDDVEIRRHAGFSSAAGETRPTLIVVATTVLDTSVIQSTNVIKASPVVVLLSDERPLFELNYLLSSMRVVGLLEPPLVSTANQNVITRVLDATRDQPAAGRLRADLAQANQLLNRRLQALNTLYTVGKFIVSSLDQDEVLKRIMDVALNTIHAEEGFILLQEGETLFLRAAKNMQDDLVERLHMKAEDEIAWRVMRSGRPVMLQRQTEIATGYLAQALLYVPLTAPGQGPFGVVAVINRTRDESFDEQDLFTLSSVADFAAITLRNAQLFETVELERSRLRALMEQATEVILIADERGRLLLWSETARLLFDIPAEARGQPIWEVVVHPDLLEFFEKAAEGAEKVHDEITLSGDKVFNAQLSYAPGLGGVLVMHDITHLKELDRLKSEFVSTVSHDLRTPLTTIQGYIALLERAGSLNELQEQFVDKSLDSLAYITDLITDLLDIGRIEAGYDMTMVPMRFDTLVEATCREMVSQAEDADITLRCSSQQAPLWVNGSANRLRQVLENLIGNAIKYGRAGGWVHIAVRANEDHVIVDVTDNGLGISVEEQARIFDRFYRVQRDETTDIKGTGLGLAIVKSVVERHSGRVWVESELNKGSTFSFVLPLIDRADAEDASQRLTS